MYRSWRNGLSNAQVQMISRLQLRMVTESLRRRLVQMGNCTIIAFSYRAVEFLEKFIPDVNLQSFYSEIQQVKTSIEGMGLESLAVGRTLEFEYP
jgi:hypothetical protein